MVMQNRLARCADRGLHGQTVELAVRIGCEQNPARDQVGSRVAVWSRIRWKRTISWAAVALSRS